MRSVTLSIGGIVFLIVAGCGGSAGTVTRYDLSGKVTYRGAPAPMGVIMFEPDTTQGNHGPGAMAKIEDGEYRTPPDKGTVGGPHIARITAGDGKVVSELAPYGKYLGKAEYRVKLDIPREDGEYDLEISTDSPK